MNPGRPLAALARAVGAVVGLALLAGGAYGIAQWAGADLQRRWSLYLDRARFDTAPDSSWWPWGLLIAAVVAAVVGVVVIAACLRPRRAPQAPLEPSPLGWLGVEPGAVADALAASLASREGIESARAAARVVEGRTTLTLRVTAAPGTPRDRVEGHVRFAAAQLVEVLGEHCPALRVLVEFAPPERRR